jgi:hypothetical protein
LGLADREAWEAAVPDGLPSQSWGYAWGLSASGIEPRLAIVRAGTSSMRVPFHVRQASGAVDVATYMATAGVTIDGDPAPVLSTWRDHARAQGWVAGYLQLCTDVEFPGGPPASLVELNEWFVLQLDGLRVPGDFSANIIQKLRGAEAARVTGIRDRDVLTDALVGLYPRTMERLGARRHYRFAEETLRRWCADPQNLLVGAGRDGEPMAVSLFTGQGSEAEYHLNAADEAGRAAAALLLCSGIAELQARGVRRLHLGGGVRRGDGLHQFKQRFRGEARPLRALREIYDPMAYVALCEKAGVAAADGWFPAYRASLDA